jgi:ankyrin repeat protein
VSSSKLPERASLPYLKKLAKDRLQLLRQVDPGVKLAGALLDVARDHGFSSWRALKAEIERRQADGAAAFFEACGSGDVERLRGLLANDAELVRAGRADRLHAGWTGLHEAAQRGHADAARLLLEHGADPNAREAGDATYPLHWAAAQGHVETVRALLDAGGDVHGFGDAHELEVIGWATVFRTPGEDPAEVVSLLLERGARHHIFSAMAAGDLELIQRLAEQNPEMLDRRMSRFEQGQTALHFAMNRKRYDILDLLIDLGADLEAADNHGHTALASAMLGGDRAAMSRLQAAGAKPPPVAAPGFRANMAEMADSVGKGVPMIRVPDIAAALAWYTAIGFREIGRYEDDGVVNFGMVSFGKAELMLALGGKEGEHDVSLWFYTGQVDRLYQTLRSRQLETAQAALDGEAGERQGVEFVEHIYDPFYGGRQFGIRDLNGYVLYFLQTAER